jgi:hypothetical protein
LKNSKSTKIPEPSKNQYLEKIAIDLKSEEKNAKDSIDFNHESFLSEIDEKDLQFQKHNELRSSTS